MKAKNLISVVGPTGIGKTRLAIDLAKHFNTEIVSCDSRQFFKEMIIGTASPSAEELAEATHHFIGNRKRNQYFRFKSQSRRNSEIGGDDER